jgi:hypothetical protein
MTYTELITNIETGEDTVRPYTAEEIAEIEKVKKLAAQEKAERDAEQAAKDAEKQAILDKLGITAEQAKLLLS